MIRFSTIFVSLILAMAFLACAPEFKDSKTDNGWKHMAVGLCQAEIAKEVGRMCTNAAECSSYCCECSDGSSYTISVCDKDQGCSDFGGACTEGKAEACGE